MICAGDGQDRVFAGNGNDIVFGGNGIDRLFGQDGNDTLHGGNDCDELDGGNGNDTLSPDGASTGLSAARETTPCLVGVATIGLCWEETALTLAMEVWVRKPSGQIVISPTPAKSRLPIRLRSAAHLMRPVEPY